MIESNTVYFVGSGPGDPELITANYLKIKISKYIKKE